MNDLERLKLMNDYNWKPAVQYWHEHYQTKCLEAEVWKDRAIQTMKQLKEVVAVLASSNVALSEAEDKFHVLSFYISDPQALLCAKRTQDMVVDKRKLVEETIKGLSK